MKLSGYAGKAPSETFEVLLCADASGTGYWEFVRQRNPTKLNSIPGTENDNGNFGRGMVRSLKRSNLNWQEVAEDRQIWWGGEGRRSPPVDPGWAGTAKTGMAGRRYSKSNARQIQMMPKS
ncbi:hypothetical protein GX50_01239 [[Emmonsia] crescens]|uniref:Uncharacterized protein n=1 Tax=[Emmonsia] crescens TaxID=73230 RepID=A0A2B7ZHF3_9EURO|nr:hypothetical protein GX50_01239 [Emmonsia crescens]